jgi:hypothetical protein
LSVSCERADARDQHREGERLGDVVVRATLERLDLIPLAVARREHQDRRPVPAVPAAGAQHVAREAGEHHVDDHRVVRVLLGEPLAIGAGQGDIDGVPLRLQPTTQRRCELLVVLDHEYPHVVTLSRAG